MPCDHCSHCSAPPVLRLPQSPAAGDPTYDRALMAAYGAATERSRQPLRLLLDVNPWLPRTRLRDQLQRARKRGATVGPDPVAVQRLLDSALWDYSQRVLRAVPTPLQLVVQGLAADEPEAQQLLDAAADHPST